MPLGCLTRLDNVEIFPKNKPVYLGGNGARAVMLTARWFDFRASGLKEFYELTEEKRYPKDFNILTSHGLLVDTPFFGKYVLVDSLVSKADLFLASDYHPGWATRRIGDTTYIAPGSFLRTDKPGNSRIPGFLHLTVSDELTSVFVPITSDHPFREESIALEREHEADTEISSGVTDKIAQETSEIAFANPTERIGQIAAEDGVSEIVKNCALTYVERAEKILRKD
jgi:hypothetical protein